MRAPHSAPVLLAVLLLAALPAPSRAQGGGASTPVPGQTQPKAKAEGRGGVSGLDAMTGTIFQEGQSSFSGIGLRLRLRSEAILPNIELMPAVEYWQNDNRVSLFGVRTKRSDATLGFAARWKVTRENWRPYFGAGVAVHFLNEQVDAPDLGVRDQQNSTVRGGYVLLGGVTFTMTKSLTNFVELEYHGVSRYRQYKLNTGLGWNFQ